jgi:WD40 repeat protein
VNSVCFSPNGRSALSGSADGTVRLWDVETGRELRRLNAGPGYVNGVAYSPDGRRALAGSTSGAVSLWELETGRELRRFIGHRDWVTGVSFSPDGRRGLSGGADLTVHLWDLESGRPMRRFDGYPDVIYNIPRRRPAVRRGFRGGTAVREAPVEIAVEAEPSVQYLAAPRHTCLMKSVVFSPDGQRVLFCNEEPTFRLWDVPSGRELHRFRGHDGCVRTVAFSPDGRLALSGSASTFGSSDNSVRLWEVESGEEVARFDGHLGWVWSVAFSPDGRAALSVGGDNVLRLWRLPARV